MEGSFRPLAGITGLRTGTADVAERIRDYVSVPLRGLRVFGPGAEAHAHTGRRSFRPLVGITGLRTYNRYPHTQTANTRFRPLAGITGLRTCAMP